MPDKKKIIWSDPALWDLDSIHHYISRDSEVYADALILQILDAVEQLSAFSDSGRQVPEMEDSKTREIIIGNYRVMYDTDSKNVYILTVLHGAGNFQK